ncbi:MAG TPA: gas vesicle protein GvpD P-loop domain-containing protein [Candidatus Nitrosotenuis sp.]
MNNIPSELLQFVKRDTYSLLIKGYAGTGKTTLALTILRALNIKENFQYISTRISPDQLIQYYPWLGQSFDIAKKTDPVDVEENSTEMPIFVDARLDEPSSMFERITNQLMDMRSPMIIIDSWDAVGYFMDREAMMNNARVLQTWRERANAKMIFISEAPTDTTFDVLVDGIVELRQRHHNDRLLREIFFSKLRGVRIDRPSYVYTLNNAIFRSFEPYKLLDLAISPDTKTKQIQQRKTSLLEGQLVKSGNAALDNVIGGGFPLKGNVSISVDSHVHNKVVLAFVGQIISNFMSAGNPVLCQCSADTDSDYLSNYLKATVPKQEISNLVLMNPPSNNKTGKKTKPKGQYLAEMAAKIKSKNRDKLLLSVIFSNASSELVMGNKCQNHKPLGDLNIVVNVGHQNEVQDSLFQNSDVSIHFLEINGTLFLQSGTPWSHLYALSIDKSNGYPTITLESMV